MRRKMKYGHNLPFCSLVMALSNGQKRTLAEHKDVAMKLTFELLHIKLLQLFFVLSHICMQLYSQRHHIRCEIWSQNELFYNLGDYMFCWNKAISALLQNKIRLFVHIYHRSSNIQDHNQCNISHSNKNQKLKCLHTISWFSHTCIAANKKEILVCLSFNTAHCIWSLPFFSEDDISVLCFRYWAVKWEECLCFAL